jgi:beta-glucosidase
MAFRFSLFGNWRSSRMRRGLFTFTVAAALCGRGWAANPVAAPYQNPATPVEQRVADLLSRLTADEKITLLSGAGYMTTHSIDRLGIPGFVMSDGPMGVRCFGSSTAYPDGVGLAATWDVTQALAAGTANGRDARARGVNILLAPGMNLYRAPMGGRNFEYYGEDPLVAGSIAAAFIQGVQSQGVAATAKHFAGNEQEYSRNKLNTTVDERTLRELYLKPFAMAVKAGVWCVMDSYNPLNGTHSTENDWLNNQYLKGELGFKGVVMSDWWASHDTLGTANGGLDLEMPDDKFYNARLLTPLIANGSVSMTSIDDKVRRQLRMAFTLGWFDRPQAIDSIRKDDPRSAAVALQGAREAIVLLKNEGGLLPLDTAKVKNIVLIGRNADPAVTGGGGSGFVTAAHVVSTLQGLAAAAGPGVKIARVPWQAGQNAVPAEWAADVKAADAVIVCVGFNDQQDRLYSANRPGAEGEGADRAYALPWGEEDLIKSVTGLNPRTIVILNAGGSVETAGWVSGVPAMIDAFYPGQEGGTAIAEVLLGRTNPSGKLPFTWEKRWEDCPAYGNYPTEQTPEANTYTEGVFAGYRGFDAKGVEPLFPFGFGLSYTTFDFSGAMAALNGKGDVQLTATVHNNGKRAGTEVMQVYVEPPSGSVPRPVRELKAFKRVTLAPGESKSVTLAIPREDLAYWDPVSKGWVVTPGSYTARVGDSSRNLPLKAGFTVGN